MKRYLLMKRHLLLLALLLGSSVGTPAFAGTTTYGQHYSSSVQSSPSNPTGAGTTGKMMGLAGSITPLYTGNVLILISGDLTSSIAADGGQVQIRYGTGTAPSNGATITGTALGGLVTLSTPGTAAAKFPFALNAIVTGLTIGTVYWIDISCTAVTGGTATPADISLSAYEL